MQQMKKACLMMALIICLLGVSWMSYADAENVWMLAVHVGKGDAILLSVDDAVVLVDTGYPYARGKILTAMEYMGVSKLDAVFITHTDKDHVGGLEWLGESGIPVDAWYASAMYMETTENKHPLAVTARSRGQEAQWLKAGDRVQLGNAVFSVLAPIEMAQDKDDNNSLVMMLETAEGRILLTGDMEFQEEETVIDSGAQLKCDVLKVGNHGDNDATSEELLSYATPKAAVISTSSAEKPGTPSGRVLRQLQKIGAQTACTQDAELGVLVRLKGGSPSIDLLDVTRPETSVVIESVDAEDDRIILRNTAAEDVDVSGWYLFSERGNEMMVFPESTMISAGSMLTVSTLSSDRQGDIVWKDKKVVHQKKDDLITLYEAHGFSVSQKGNGR